MGKRRECVNAKLIALTLTVMLAVLASPPNVRAGDDSDSDSDSEERISIKVKISLEKSDFALFDGTNPLDRDEAGKTGVLCGNSNKKGTALKAKAFKYHFSMTNFDTVARECKVLYSGSLVADFVRYKIPAGTSLNINQSGGSNEFDSAVRLDCDMNVAGAGSAIGRKTVFCLSCAETADTDAVCDMIVPSPPSP